MNTIADSYRFKVDIPGVGQVLMYPQNAELKWIWKKKKGYRFYQRTLETKLNFIDAPGLGLFDFTKLANIERSGMTCERINISLDIYCECDNTWSIDFYRGYLKLAQADRWDFELCQVGLPVVVDDAYGCLTTNWVKEFNMFDYGDPPTTVSPFLGVVQTKECYDEHTITFDPLNDWTIQEMAAVARQYWIDHKQIHCLTDNVPPSAHPWTIIKHTYLARLQIIGPQFPFDKAKAKLHLRIRTKWAREFFAGGVMPPGPLWEPCAGGFHRPVVIANGNFWKYTVAEERPLIAADWNVDAGDYNDGELWSYIIVGLGPDGNPVLTNGKSMGPVIQEWLDAVCPGTTLVSNFYQINPDGSQPVNDYYTRRAEDFDEIVLFQVTDVARLDETVSATKALIKLKDLFDTMKIPHNTDLELDSVDGSILRWEHQSYWERPVGVDLTQPDKVDANGRPILEGKFVYTVDNDTQPNTEEFGWSTETDKLGGDFDGWPIEYVNACVEDRDEPQVEQNRSAKFLTNVAFVTGNADFFDSKEVLIVAKRGGIVELKQMPVTPGDTFSSGAFRLNGALALKYCLPRYHDFGRPFKEGFINKVLVPMYRTQRPKKQVPISFNMSCLDYRDNFRAEHTMKTQLGAGEIDQAEWVEPQEEMTVILKHK